MGHGLISIGVTISITVSSTQTPSEKWKEKGLCKIGTSRYGRGFNSATSGTRVNGVQGCSHRRRTWILGARGAQEAWWQWPVHMNWDLALFTRVLDDAFMDGPLRVGVLFGWASESDLGQTKLEWTSAHQL